MLVRKGPGFKLVPKTSTSIDDAPFTPGRHKVQCIPYCDDPERALLVDEILLRLYNKRKQKEHN